MIPSVIDIFFIEEFFLKGYHCIIILQLIFTNLYFWKKKKRNDMVRYRTALENEQQSWFYGHDNKAVAFISFFFSRFWKSNTIRSSEIKLQCSTQNTF